MLIGIPREIMSGEKRVAGNPEAIAKIAGMGFQVVVESGAGAGIHVDDQKYRDAGATVVPTAPEVFAAADIILKVKQLGFNNTAGIHEADMMRPGTMLVTFMHPASPTSRDVVLKLKEKNITSFTMDSIPRTSRAQAMDALTSMSTVTGYKAVIHAACLLPVFVPMMGTAIGMLKPARFLIVGCGVVGLQALATAKRLGGVTTCVDIRPDAREQGKSLGAKVEGFDVSVEFAMGQGGYARALPEEWLDRERQALALMVEDADVVVLSALVPGEVAPILVTREMVSRMRPGSVVVDIAIDQGGNCEATQPGKEVVVNDVTVSGIQNVPGSVPVHATHLYAINMVNFLSNLFPAGPAKVNWDDEIVRATLVTHEGRIIHEGTLKALASGN